MTAIPSQARPRLGPGVRLRLDHVTGNTLLLRPEQGFELRGSATAIVKLCTGEVTVGEIVQRLAASHPDVTSAQIANDVDRLLVDLSRRGLIRFEET